jgi:outer membrane protein assembly factor BamB
MVSLRFNDLVFVMDPSTSRIKWYQRGPWKGQHDPDFLADGRIRVFSNNYDGNEVETALGGSSIIDVDPRTGAVGYRYGPDDPPMFTAHSGEHQTFENGNVLIAESHAGRVFEVTPDGTVVWEFINRYDEASLAFISGATRYPEHYFSVKDWACTK